MMSTRFGSKLLGLQMARGVAALMVVLYHSGRLLGTYSGFSHDAYGNFFRFGHSGVDFFFVLSGFIIFYVHRKDIGNPSGLTAYLWKRATRIYPIYWFVISLIILQGILLPSSGRFSLAEMLQSISLVPSGHDLILGVAWTLEHEILFYAMFSLLIVSRRIGLIAFIAWFSVVAFNSLHPMNGFIGFIGSAYHIDFMFGMCAAVLLGSKWSLSVPYRTLLWSGFAALLVSGVRDDAGIISDYNDVLCVLSYGSAFTLILIGIVGGELLGWLRIWNPFVYLGAMSYSLYLFHVPVISRLYHVFFAFKMAQHTPPMVLALAGVSVGLLSSAILHSMIEKPALDYLQGLNVFRHRHRVSAVSN